MCESESFWEELGRSELFSSNHCLFAHVRHKHWVSCSNILSNFLHVLLLLSSEKIREVKMQMHKTFLASRSVLTQVRWMINSWHWHSYGRDATKRLGRRICQLQWTWDIVKSNKTMSTCDLPKRRKWRYRNVNNTVSRHIHLASSTPIVCVPVVVSALLSGLGICQGDHGAMEWRHNLFPLCYIFIKLGLIKCKLDGGF